MHLADAVDVVTTTLAASAATALGAETPVAGGVADVDGTVGTGSTLVAAAELTRRAGLNTDGGEGNDSNGLGKVHDGGFGNLKRFEEEEEEEVEWL